MGKVAIIGCGFVGRAWAVSHARAGHDVVLWDAQPEAPAQALAYIDGILPDLAANDLLDGVSVADVRARMRPAENLAEALAGAAHVQENVPEVVELKRAVFAELDASAAPDAVLASSTSAILPSAFTATLAGHAPIVMKRELDGFVMNRLQGALLDEAFRLVADGCASIEDVDIGIREGLALRWAFMGPFETIDLNAPGGVRDYAERYEQIYARIFPTVQWRADWSGPVMDVIEADRRKLLPADRLKERQAWRDRRLMALAAHKRRAAREIGS